VSASFAVLDKIAKLPWPISFPILGLLGILFQAASFIVQGIAWLSRGCKSHGEGDSRVLRTPDSCFDDLDGFPFPPNYFEHNSCRLHYLDEGPKDAKEVVVLIHGMPTWSFLYRNVIPPVVKEGHRVLALDYLGRGRSDKPVDSAQYTFASHVDSISALLSHVKINMPCLTLVIHDWGGVVGQGALPSLDGLLKRLVVLNTLGVGPNMMGTTGLLSFFIWQAGARLLGRYAPIADLCAGAAGGKKIVSPEAAAGYGAPFLNADYKAMPSIWPLFYNNTYTTWRTYSDALVWARENLKVPILVAFSTEDVIVDHARAMEFYRSWMKNAPAVEGIQIPDAGHFLQEVHPEEVSNGILTFIRKHP
jgi:haloalkane dehalogenase